MDEVTIAVIVGIIAVIVVGYFVLKWLGTQQWFVGTEDQPRDLEGVVYLDPENEEGEPIVYAGHYQPLKTGKHGHPSQLTVTLEFEIAGEFTLVRESSFDKFCKRIGLAQEVNTGDQAFDDLIYIQTDNPEYAKRYFADADKRQVVRDLFEHGFTQIEHNGDALTATWVNYPNGGGGCEADAEETAALLASMTRNLPPTSTIRRPRRVLSRRALPWMNGIGIAAAVALGILLGIVMSMNSFPIAHWKLLGISLGIVAVVLLVYAYVGAWFVRGHSTSHLQFGTLLLWGLLAFPSLGILTTERLNCWLDSEPAVDRVETVVDKREHKNKNNRNYYLKVACWSEPGRVLELKTDATIYARVQSGQTQVQLRTHPGRLGFEWIESFSIVNPPKGPVP